MVISAGASNLPLIAQSPDMLLSLRQAYTNAVRHVFIYAVAAACIGFVFTFGFEHRNVKKVAKDRKAAEELSNKEDDANQCLPSR
jgi:phosphotransferase system  glucose/maltose/N-acetylglucosamine-specific IIC component